MSINDKTGNPQNQPARRNLTDGWKIELELGNKQDLLEIGLQKKSIAGGDKKSAAAKSLLSINDKTDPPHNTREIIAGNDQA